MEISRNTANTCIMGLGMWPDDDPAARVRLVVEPIRSPFTAEHVAEEADVSGTTVRRELPRLKDQGVVEFGDGEWRVQTEQLDEDGLFPEE